MNSHNSKITDEAQDETIKLEPPVYLASEQQDWPAEFHCSIPVGLLARASKQWQRTGSNQPEKFVRWLRNGRLLPVSWTFSQQQAQQRSFRARQSDTNPSEFILSVGRPDRHLDDNSNFTCRLKWDADSQDEDLVPGYELHESQAASLRFDLAPGGATGEPRAPPIKFDIPMGQPIGGDIISGPPKPSNYGLGASHNQNNTTQMNGAGGDPAQAPPGGINDNRIRPTLTETLADLYQIAKPSLILLGIMSLVALIVLFQFACVRRRAEAHRYMKHGHHHHNHLNHNHHHQYSTSSGSSANSSGACAGGASSDASAEPILAGLMAWAPSASSLGAGATKKFKYHRDHMRAKVAATGDHQLVMDETHHDFIDAATYFAAASAQNHHQHDYQGASLLFGRTTPTGALPNLYNQSLAAREQARSLLQAGEHVRSMGNLTSSGQLQRLEMPVSKQHEMLMSKANARRNVVQHHLELPTNFAYINTATNNSTGPLELNATSLMQRDLHQRRQATEQYQLVSCSSVSPSSTSSVVAGSNSSSNASTAAATSGARSHQQKAVGGQLETSSQRETSTNHYSMICQDPEVGNSNNINNRNPDCQVRQLIQADDYDERYEELESNVCLLRTSARSSTASKLSNQFKTENTRNFNRKSSFGTGQSNDSAPMAPPAGGPWRRLNRDKERSSDRTRGSIKQPSCVPDQLSPYAVSSIYHGQQSQQVPLPPPVSSEAMRALTEQLDIHQLMMADRENTNPTTSETDEDEPRVGLSLPPPPPPPSSSPPAGRDNQSRT